MSDALPEAWMDRIWQRLTVRYGQQFLGKWAGVDLADVKADWAEQLASFSGAPDRIKYALDNLPDDKPPNVFMFRDLCNAAPDRSAPQLPAPKADPAKVAQVLGGIKRPDPAHPKAWAHRLIERHAQGLAVSSWGLKIAREVAGAQ